MEREESKDPPLAPAVVSSQPKRHKLVKGGKKLVDPAAPKAPPNCFILFSNDNRESVRRELEAAGKVNVKAPMIANELGRRWSLLSKEDKMKYEDKFKEGMIKFEIAKAAYKPSEEFLLKIKLREEKLINQNAGSNPERSPPGMMKAYFDFVAGNWMRVALAHPGMSPGDMQKVLWKQWAGQGEVGGRKGKTKNVKKRARIEVEPQKRGTLVNNFDVKIGGNDNVIEISSEGSDPNSAVPDFGTKCKTPPSNMPVAVTSSNKQDKKPTLTTQEWVETAYSFFQTQLKEELRRLMPDMGEEEMTRSVRQKWREMSESQKEIFYKEILQSHAS